MIEGKRNNGNKGYIDATIKYFFREIKVAGIIKAVCLKTYSSKMPFLFY